MKRSFGFFAAVCSFMVFAALPLQAQQVTLTWTAGGAGGGWYSIAGGIATIIKEADADIVIKVIPGGGLQNPAVVASKGAEIGWGLPFLNAAAYKGMAPFEKPLEELRALAGGMSMNYFHFYVDAESPLNSMDEIFGQKKKVRLAISQAGSSDTWVLERVLDSYKTSIPDLEKAGFTFLRGNYAFQANQFKDQNADGVFTFLAIPGAAVTEASVGRKLKLIDFSESSLKHLEQFGITKGKIPAGTYEKAANTKDVVTAVAGSVITVHKDMSDELAYRLTKAFNDSYEKVRKVHSSMETYEIKDGPTGCGLPLHPGAIKYYKEKGLLK
jgi:TRAP transporter TAXI family solute receptor